MKKLFAVEIEGEIVVAAESEDAAVQLANTMIDGYNSFKDDLCAISARVVQRKEDLPEQWDADCLPYGLTDTRSIGEILAGEPK